ncbi:MAG: hypothetical protein H7175_15635, partial [Burkholderiales bacterium]|nr:hypothetical protein [Anaerolineae bacterium]
AGETFVDAVDIVRKQPTRIIERNGFETDDIEPSPDGLSLAIAGEWGTRLVYNLASGENATILPTDSAGNPMSLAWSPDSECIAFGFTGGTIFIWQASNGQMFTSLSGHDTAIVELEWSADGSRLYSGDRDNTVRVWGSEQS